MPAGQQGRIIQVELTNQDGTPNGVQQVLVYEPATSEAGQETKWVNSLNLFVAKFADLFFRIYALYDFRDFLGRMALYPI